MSPSGFVIAAVVLTATLSAPLPLPARTPAGVQSTDVQIYEAFRAWVTRQPPGDSSAALERYKQALAEQGLDRAEVERRVAIITRQGQRLEIERWNRILTSPSPAFNTRPNAFLVRMTEGRTPGTALDVGMGQGRNAIYLAQQGWTVTGFDPADQAVAAAANEAQRLGIRLATLVADDEHFDFGRGRWDLIVLSYVGVRHLIDRARESLKPGGLVVVEGFHRDATKDASIGGAVVFDTNELLTLFDDFRIVRYEDARGVGDFGMRETRIVRLAAEKR